MNYQDTVEYVRAVSGGVAYDLKNFLANIGGAAQQALRALNNPDVLSQVFQIIYKQVVNADQHMYKLLSFCIYTGVLSLTTQDVNPLVQDVVDMMCRDKLLEGVKLAFHLAASPLQVPCDDLQLKRALHNVVANAIRSTRQYGQGTVLVTIKADKENAQIRVHNDGVRFRKPQDTRGNVRCLPQCRLSGRIGSSRPDNTVESTRSQNSTVS